MKEPQEPKKQLPQARSIRLTKNLDERCEEYLRRNGINFNMLVRMAVDEFISSERTFRLEPISREVPKFTVVSMTERKRQLDADSKPMDNDEPR